MQNSLKFLQQRLMVPKIYTLFAGFFPNTKRVKLQKDDFREVVLKFLSG